MQQQQSKKQLKNMTESVKLLEKSWNTSQPSKQTLFFNPKRLQALNEYYPDIMREKKTNNNSLSFGIRKMSQQSLKDVRQLINLSFQSQQSSKVNVTDQINAKLKSILNSKKPNLAKTVISQQFSCTFKSSFQNSSSNSDKSSSFQYLNRRNSSKKPILQLDLKNIDSSQNSEILKAPSSSKSSSSAIQKFYLSSVQPKTARNVGTEDKLSAQQILQKLKQQLSNPSRNLGNTSQKVGLRKLDDNISINKKMKVVIDSPLSGTQALLKYGNLLSNYEKKEITDYDNIYFIGQDALKIHSFSPQDNYGYDNDKDELLFVIKDHIAYRYENVSHLGQGSFGQVFKAYDHKNSLHVALKVIKNKRRFHSQALVEVQMLKAVNQCESMIQMREYFLFRNHMCIVFELLSCNLYEMLRSNHFRGFSQQLVRRWAIQLLQCLLELEKKGIVHCDLKPENILLKEPGRSGIKVIDFGSSCFRSNKIFTYIQSRFYRAPEIILGLPYDTEIDLWSFGCIMVEFITGMPLFASDSEQDHMALILEVIGSPPPLMLKESSKGSKFFDSKDHPLVMTSLKGERRFVGVKPLEYLLRDQRPNFIEFVQLFLKWQPEQRMSAAQGLVHPWILEGLPKPIRRQHLHAMKQNAPHLPIFNDPNLSDYFNSMILEDENQGIQGECQD